MVTFKYLLGVDGLIWLTWLTLRIREMAYLSHSLVLAEKLRRQVSFLLFKYPLRMGLNRCRK
jgi:hypothetical protein